ncbi:MAG: hypothetical protein U5L03_06830 [Burkholderiaceae bacterium]|nr:hypothetical protein [Burkholderiaceae bacterium]
MKRQNFLRLNSAFCLSPRRPPLPLPLPLPGPRPNAICQLPIKSLSMNPRSDSSTAAVRWRDESLDVQCRSQSDCSKRLCHAADGDRRELEIQLPFDTSFKQRAAVGQFRFRHRQTSRRIAQRRSLDHLARGERGTLPYAAAGETT